MTTLTTSVALTDHGGIRTIEVGPITITRVIAHQLDRLDIWTNVAQEFNAIARVKTGLTVSRDRIKPEYRHYPKDLLKMEHYEPYDVVPLEVIGYYDYPDNNDLSIFQVSDYVDLKRENLDTACDEEEWPAVRAAVAAWKNLPLAVLP